MPAIGFLNLPDWQDKLQRYLSEYKQTKLLRAPVLGSENVEHPWVALESEDFFSVVDTGIVFNKKNCEQKFTETIITDSAVIAVNRLKKGLYDKTFFKGALGGLFSFFGLLDSTFYTELPKRLIVQNDAVTGFILSKMEKENKTLDEATQEARWTEITQDNPNKHLHGVITLERFILQVVETFEVFVNPESVKYYGVNTLDLKDVRIADKLGYSIRLLGIAQNCDNGVQICVEPCFIPAKYFLAQAKGGSEILYMQRANNQAEVYACPGASYETSVRGILTDIGNLSNKKSPIKFVDEPKELEGNFYIRIRAFSFADIPKVISIFTKYGINLNFINFNRFINTRHNGFEYFDYGNLKNKNDNEFIAVTETTVRSSVHRVCEKINAELESVVIESVFRFIK